MKSQLYKAALLAALGLAGVSAQAQTVTVNGSYAVGDLLVGIYQPGANNTTVLDIGAASSLFNGETWNLSSFLTAAGITLGSTAQYGVIGYNSAHTTFLTASDVTGDPADGQGTLSFGDFGPVSAAIGTIGNAEGSQSIASSGGLDWFNQTINNNAGFFANTGYQVNATVGSEDVLYALPSNNSQTTDLAFNLSTGGTLTYGTVAVPEPATYGLLAGAGLLVISLRNQFRRKQA